MTTRAPRSVDAPENGPSVAETAEMLADLRRIRTRLTGNPHARWEDLPEAWADLIEPAKTLDAKLSDRLKTAPEDAR